MVLPYPDGRGPVDTSRLHENVPASLVLLRHPFPLCHTCLWTCLSCFSPLLSCPASEQDLPRSCLLCTSLRPWLSTEAKRCSDTLTCAAEEMIHGRSTSLLWGNCACQRGRTDWGACFSHPAPRGTCISQPPIWSGSTFRAGKADGSPAAVSRHLDGLHPLQTSSNLFKPTQTHPLPSKFSLQPTKDRGAASTWLFLSSAICWVLTCHKEGAGTSFRCGRHCCKSMWCGCYFLSHQVWNLRVFGCNLTPVTPLELLSVHAHNPFWNAEKPSLNQESSRCYYSSRVFFLLQKLKAFLQINSWVPAITHCSEPSLPKHLTGMQLKKLLDHRVQR